MTLCLHQQKQRVMKKSTSLIRITAILLIIVTFSSCNGNNGVFQKRKYTKGHHISLKKKVASNTTKKQQESLSQAAKEDEVGINSNDLVSRDTIVGYADQLITVNNSKALEKNKIEKQKKLKTPSQKNVLLAKITSHIEKSEFGRKITRVVNLKNGISSATRDSRFSTFVKIIFAIGGLFFLGLGLIGLSYQFTNGGDGGIMAFTIGFLALSALLFIQIGRKPPTKTKEESSDIFLNILTIVGIIIFGISSAAVLIFGSYITTIIVGTLFGILAIFLTLLLVHRTKKRYP